jgi:hypothetical protein
MRGASGSLIRFCNFNLLVSVRSHTAQISGRSRHDNIALVSVAEARVAAMGEVLSG